MAEQIYQDSSYRFTDPIRFFKANDPYYFEVDNIPLKQLQENSLWLKDQLKKTTETRITEIKRADIEELRPYALGGDRVIRVKPGRYTSRINDASDKTPLAYLEKVLGEAVGEVDVWEAVLPNAGRSANNSILEAALDQFKSTLSQDALAMAGLTERAFTWPVVTPDTPINHTGVITSAPEGNLQYAGPETNIFGNNAYLAPMVISQALVWAKSLDASQDVTTLTSYEFTNPQSGFSKFPRTENFFIKRWRGVARLAVVDVPSELTVEVPSFDPEDFAYTNTDGTLTQVAGVESRIDMVFIYSKPVDMSGVSILKSSGKQKINSPQLGIVRGAGIRANFKESTNTDGDYLSTGGDPLKILASPGDQNNTNLGFTAASGNDIEYDIRGSFPAPDDILNLAPLISEKLEESAIELVGQSIMPIAYVFVQNGSSLVSDNDVVDIRPFFRTAELAYNERTGIAAAFPQLSLANPAVGKGQMDYELRRVYQDLEPRIQNLEAGEGGIIQDNSMSMATGYIFGGYNFGPEGALYNFYQQVYGDDSAGIDDRVKSEFGYGGANLGTTIPARPDWDLSDWVTMNQDLENAGSYPNDYLNTFFGSNIRGTGAGSNSQYTDDSGNNIDGTDPAQLNDFQGSMNKTGHRVSFHYIKKTIPFVRPTWLGDYSVNVEFLNCLPLTSPGGAGPGSYTGIWVEKGYEEFTIYVAFAAMQTTGMSGDYANTRTPGTPTATFPAPYQTTIVTSASKKKKTSASITVVEREGGRFSSFIVPVTPVLQQDNDTPYSTTAGAGYIGNPRMGLCTYPTVTWNFQGVPINNAPYHYSNLGSGQGITLKLT